MESELANPPMTECIWARANLDQVQEKFMLDVSEEVAIKQFEALLNDTSYLTVMFDRIHDWSAAVCALSKSEAKLTPYRAQYLRD
jgi:hypothetical protein